MGGITDFVADGRNGLLFDGRDAADLARKLDRLAQEPGLLERLQEGISPPRAFADHVDELEAYYRGERPRRGHTGVAPLSVRWRGDHGSTESLAGVNRGVCDRLEQMEGIALERVSRTGAGGGPALPLPAHVEVRHQFPPDLRPPASGRLAVIQPWEFGAAPAEWVDGINRNVDELWVPSAHVRDTYIGSGVDPERVAVVPNGVDLETFSPDGPAMELDGAGVRLLFVGGLIDRKGPDLLVAAFLDAFAGRDDVTLVIKDFGADGIYPKADRRKLREYSESGQLPRIVYLHRDMPVTELASLYRACDVLVHPYRGEGFGMPVLEAMACGLPAVVTAGGPTDEFCPPTAGWRVAAERRPLGGTAVGSLETLSPPWMLEPSLPALVHALGEVDTGRDQLTARGAAARAAAEAYGWDAIADAYAHRISALARRQPLAGPAPAPLELPDAPARALLATPAWRGQDRLAELLRAWADAFAPGAPVGLYLLADPQIDGAPADWETHVLAAAGRAGVDLAACADISVLDQAMHGRDAERLHAAVDAYVPLHDACGGHLRTARALGARVLEPTAVSLLAWDARTPSAETAAIAQGDR
jgi:glycosyltransferase involved in cell wall biosynthesis